jgi:diacylglycerol kinase (ATP)
VQLVEGVFLGRRHSQAEAAASDYDSILDLTAEYPEVPAFLQRIYLSVPVLDLTSPSVGQMRQAVSFIESERRQGRRVLVHCSFGLGRSCAIAAAYLILNTDAPSVKTALARVKAVQPRLAIWPATIRVLRKLPGYRASSLEETPDDGAGARTLSVNP